jgi:prepilin-type N-terminal cleavage/methylation domain-containing protein
MRRQAGFSLIELIVVMVMLGILLTAGATFFTYTIRGLATSRTAVEIGQSTQLSLDRIAYELRHATNRPGFTTVRYATAPHLSFTYGSTAPGLTGTTRTIEIIGTDLMLTVGNTQHQLMESVTDFTMTLTEQNIDGDGTNGLEISRINISFRVTGYGGTFSIEAAPRQFIRQ